MLSAATGGPTNLAGYAKCTLCGTDDIINSRGAKLRHLAHPRCQRQERLPEWVDKMAQEMQEKRRRDNARSMRRKRTAAKAAEDSSQIMNNAAAEHVRLPSVSTPTFTCTHLYGFPVTARILSTLQPTTHFSRSAFCYPQYGKCSCRTSKASDCSEAPSPRTYGMLSVQTSHCQSRSTSLAYNS